MDREKLELALKLDRELEEAREFESYGRFFYTATTDGASGPPKLRSRLNERSSLLIANPDLERRVRDLVNQALPGFVRAAVLELERERNAACRAAGLPIDAEPISDDRAPDDGKVPETNAVLCMFDRAYQSPCPNAGTVEVNGVWRCPQHASDVCILCGEPATRSCPDAGQFVCGFPLCDDCEHFREGDRSGHRAKSKGGAS